MERLSGESDEDTDLDSENPVAAAVANLVRAAGLAGIVGVGQQSVALNNNNGQPQQQQRRRKRRGRSAIRTCFAKTGAFLASMLPPSLLKLLSEARSALARIPPASWALLSALAIFDLGVIAGWIIVGLVWLPGKYFVIAGGLVILVGALLALNYTWLTRRAVAGEFSYVGLGTTESDRLTTDGRYEAADEDDDAVPELADPLASPRQPSLIIGDRAGLIISGRWVLKTKLGEGRFAEVRLATDTMTRKEVAVKTIPLSTPRSALFAFREAAVMLALPTYPNIPSLIDVVQTPEAIHLIMERASGIELFDHCDTRPDGCLAEAEARAIVTQLLSTLAHIHSKGILHRDCKLDNILYDARQGKAMLIDFGLATFIHSERVIDEPTGTVAYSSPDLLALRAEGEPYFPDRGWSDVWALGVTTYGWSFVFVLAFCPSSCLTVCYSLFPAMLTGRFPFPSSEDNPAALLRLLRTNPTPSVDPALGLSKEAESFLIATLDPQTRGKHTAASLLAHPWIGQPHGPEPGDAEPVLASGHDWRAQLKECKRFVDNGIGKLRTSSP